MAQISVTTRWAGFPAAVERLGRLLEGGIRQFVVHAELREEDISRLRAFLPRGTLAAVELFAPLPQTLPAGVPRPFRLGSLHPEERRDALVRGKRTIEEADAAGIPLAILPPGVTENPTLEEVLSRLAKKTPDRIWEGLWSARTPSLELQMGSYRGTLSALLDHADRYGIALAMVLGGHPAELPTLDEAARCLEEFRGAPLSLWADLLRDSRRRKSGGKSAERLRGDLKPRLRGITVRGSDGEREHLLPSAGEIDWTEWKDLREPAAATGAAAAPFERLWVLDVAPDVADEDLLRARKQLDEFLHGPEEEQYEPFSFRPPH